MKKYLLLFVSIFILTGCTNIDNLDYSQVITKTLEENSLKTNTYLEGYKLYLPQHMTLIGDLAGNDILYSYGDKYYLYVDLVSYYNKKPNYYSIDSSNYTYSHEITNNDKNGYVLVSKSKGGYLVEVMYNYAKIEVITNDIKRAISDSLIVLKNIEYNYKIIDSMIGSNTLVYDSKLFTLGPEKNTDSFLQYVEEYGVYDEKNKENDEDVIDMNSSD